MTVSTRPLALPIFSLLGSMLLFSCDGNRIVDFNEPAFGGIAHTYENGQLVTDDETDWLPRTTGQPGAGTAFSPAVPNPASAGTTLRISLAEAAHIRIWIVNRFGDHVRTLSDDIFAAGEHTLDWDLKNDSGKKVRIGLHRVYFQITYEGETESSYSCGDIEVAE